MRYLFIGLILLVFTGCGSSGTTYTEDNDNGNVIKPVSPTPKDSSKQPPSIPNI